MRMVPAKIVDLTMEEEGYRRRGTAAAVSFKGQIEGRVILDMEPGAAAQVASFLAGSEGDPAGTIVTETVCELGNMGIGECGDAIERCGISFQGAAAGSFDAGTVREGGTGFGSDDTLF